MRICTAVQCKVQNTSTLLSTAFCTVVLVIYSGSTDMEMLDMNMANGENERTIKPYAYLEYR